MPHQDEAPMDGKPSASGLALGVVLPGEEVVGAAVHCEHLQVQFRQLVALQGTGGNHTADEGVCCDCNLCISEGCTVVLCAPC
jgi:hypothetical protein